MGQIANQMALHAAKQLAEKINYLKEKKRDARRRKNITDHRDAR